MYATDLLQLKRLAIFATVVEQGSFAKAAELLQMSRSSVSEQVALLEEALKVRLLQRTTRQLTLTTDGQAVYPQAAQLNQALRQVNELVTQEQPQGRIRITTTADLALDWLNPKLQAFRALYPQIYVDLVLTDHELDVIAGQLDLALRIGYLKDDSLVVRPLFNTHVQIIASAAYLAQAPEPITLESLPRQYWVLLKQLNPNQSVTLQHNGEMLHFVPEHYHSCDSPLVMQQLIKLGFGIGLHLPVSIQRELANQELSLILPQWQGDELTFCLAYPSRRQLPLRVRYLIDFLLQQPAQWIPTEKGSL